MTSTASAAPEVRCANARHSCRAREADASRNPLIFKRPFGQIVYKVSVRADRLRHWIPASAGMTNMGVVPAKAGTQRRCSWPVLRRHWIPASAGMTKYGCRPRESGDPAALFLASAATTLDSRFRGNDEIWVSSPRKRGPSGVVLGQCCDDTGFPLPRE
jgi:hypothetical protein